MNNISFMNITFDNPYLLLLMIPIIAIAFIPYLRLKPKRRHTRNKVTSLILHCLIIIISCFVLSGIEGHSIENVDSEVVLVTDYSESTKEVHKEMDDYVDSFLKDGRNNGSNIGLVYFGYGETQFTPTLEKPSKVNKSNLKKAEIDSTGTDIENAITKAVELFNSNKKSKLVKRIILLSDGVDTDGQIATLVEDTNGEKSYQSTIASALNANGIRLDAVMFEPKDYTTTAEAQIQGIKVADGVVPFKPTKITASFKSHAVTSVELNITDNGKSIFKEKKTITLKGTRIEEEFEFEYTFNEAGIHELKASIKAINNNDVVAENNTFYAYAYLEAENSILIIANPNEDATKLETAISSYGYNPTVIAPVDAPSAEGLSEYKEVILMNIDAVSLPQSFATQLRAYVEKFGGSVLTAGGKTTYENGNMKGTIFEDMLQISLTPAANNPRAIVLCLDYSNSMGMKTFDGTQIFSKTDEGLQTPQRGTRIDTAIKGIVASIEESLNPYDYLSVITFGPIKPDKGINETKVVFGLTPATQKDAMKKKVQAIRKPSKQGGTDYDEALEYAEDMLTSFQKKVNKKSVVLINDYDGSNDDATKYMDTIRRMDKKGIDMSAIVIGNQKSANVIEMESVIGSGNSYLAQTENQFKTIIKELCRSIPTKTVNELNAKHPFEFEDGTRMGAGVTAANLPSINTYNGGVIVKEGATSHVFYHNQEWVQDPAFPNDPNKKVQLDNHDPIYAAWTFGKGKVGSLMIDLSGEWCPDFYTNVETQKLLENIIKDLAPKQEVDFMRITVDGFLLQDDPKDIKVMNANYSRKLEIELLKVEDEINENGEIVEKPTQEKISLNVVISRYEDITKNKLEKVVDFKLESDTGDKFERDFKTMKPGLYRIDVSYTANGEKVERSAYTAFSYSDEFDTFYDTSAKYAQLVEVCESSYTETGDEKINGKVFYGTTGIEENAEQMASSIEKTTNFQLPLMILALLLFVIDIAVRKFNFLWPHELIKKFKEKRAQE